MTAFTNIAAKWEVASWADTCERYDDEWVCVTDIEDAEDGSIRCARVLSHSPDIEKALAQVGHLLPPATSMRISLVNTKGRRLGRPRIVEFLDEGDTIHAEREVTISYLDGDWP